MRIFLTILIFLPFFSCAQTEYVTKQLYSFFFYNHQRNCFTVIDDSNSCHEYNPIKKQWETRKLKMFIEEPFSKFLENFLVLHEKNSEIFFVDRGCGQVYVLKNDSIYRHDHSFHHQNQFGGLFFIYNNEPHIFGGYGLFTTKNIVTRYDLEDREWYHYEFQGNAPKSRKNSMGKVVNNKLYITGGYYPVLGKENRINDLWVFDFKNISWKYLGATQRISTSQLEVDNLTVSFSDDFWVSSTKICKFNFVKNKIAIFKNPLPYKLKKIIKIKNLILFCKMNSTGDFANYSVVENYKFVPYASKNLVEIPKSNFSFGLIIVIFTFILTCLLLMFLKRKNKQKIISVNNSFDPMELKLLELFYKNENQGIEISFINDIVNQDNPSIDTLKKRRENLVRELKNKISKECKIPVETVFLEEKSVLDKRIKIMKLNPIVFKKYTGLFDSN